MSAPPLTWLRRQLTNSHRMAQRRLLGTAGRSRRGQPVTQLTLPAATRRLGRPIKITTTASAPWRHLLGSPQPPLGSSSSRNGQRRTAGSWWQMRPGRTVCRAGRCWQVPPSWLPTRGNGRAFATVSAGGQPSGDMSSRAGSVFAYASDVGCWEACNPTACSLLVQSS
jgi:hypothetical protein